MSRAAWAGLLMLGGGLGLIAFLLTRGLPDESLTAVDNVQRVIEQNRVLAAEQKDAFDAVVAKDSAFLGELPDIQRQRSAFAEKQKGLDEAQALLDGEIKAIVDKNSHGDGEALLALTRKADELANRTAGAANPAGTARHLLGYKTNHARLMTTAREQIASAQVAQADPTLQQQIELATTRYPEAQAALQKRQAAIATHAAQVAKSGAELERLASAGKVDYVQAGKTADAIGAGHDKLNKMSVDLRGDMAQLSKSIDKILIDMKEEGGRYFHSYRIIENGVERKPGWEEVTRSKYQQHRDHLGMSIYSKPEGKLADEAETVASPPGYAYVGNTRYGHWEQRNGQSFWVFYGKYSLMRNLLWGSGRYRPIQRSNYRTYRSTVRSGKAWYGAKKQYGTKGTLTKTRYANSNYYKKARRTSYSGSKYSGSGRSGSRYSGSGSGSSGRRSGGSRGSRYRSSSFGGSGK